MFLLSFVTDLWTPQNVALMILTPQSKNSSRAPEFTRSHCAPALTDRIQFLHDAQKCQIILVA